MGNWGDLEKRKKEKALGIWARDSESLYNCLGAFYSKLQDDISRSIFDARFKYFMDHEIDDLERNLLGTLIGKGDINRTGEYAKYINKYPEKRGNPIVIFGAGLAGKRSVRTIKFVGGHIAGVVDNNPALNDGSCEIEGIQIEKPDVLKEKYKDAVIFVAVRKNVQIDVYYQLIGLGVNPENIIMCAEASIFAMHGRQYFDLPEVEPDAGGEFFLDAGCYDGNTSLGASKWANGQLRHVYAFEADKNNLSRCKLGLEKIGCGYDLYNLATWSKKDVLRFFC